VYLQVSAEEIKDNRVVLLEMEARKLDNKVGSMQISTRVSSFIS
jgi:hypothetical protein